MVTFKDKIFRLTLQLLIPVIFPVAASAQTLDEMKKIFEQAESYNLYEEYELANQLYILLETPDNLNIKYKIGTCYLNIPGEKEKSIPYLEEAVKNASYNAKPDQLKELRAPLDAYFFLAKAYMINYELEKALNTLSTFKKLAEETKSKGGMKNLGYIDQQIQACNNAIKFKANPVKISKKLLGNDFSQGSINENPAVSYDGNSMVYTERRGIVNVILFSKKERGKWQPPVEITSELNAGEDCSSCSLNSDGTELFLYKTDNFDGAIYSSDYINGRWTPIKKLNKNINTKYYESHAAVSADGKKLYFASNRKGGLGNLDIYFSEKDSTGDWGQATNLGATINTPFNEDTPFITQNDTVLYFSSEGHNSMGGYDNYKSQKMRSSWKTPLNLGYPVNSTDDDKFFQPVNNGSFAFYSMTIDYKQKDIFILGLGNNDVNKLFGDSAAVIQQMAYDKIDPTLAPTVSAIDTSILIRNMNVNDLGDKNINDSDVLYYTVQLLALYKPIDVSFFKYITDIKVMYSDVDKFYRYTSGKFATREEAYNLIQELRRKGYPEDMFVKKVSKQ
jgi:hypothetical protein